MGLFQQGSEAAHSFKSAGQPAPSSMNTTCIASLFHFIEPELTCVRSGFWLHFIFASYPKLDVVHQTTDTHQVPKLFKEHMPANELTD
jgi:hypothetical protein